ncbi:unnamed protein product [Rhodiola kirilowii]
MGLSVSVLLSACKEISTKVSIFLSNEGEGERRGENYTTNVSSSEQLHKDDSMSAVGQCAHQVPDAYKYEENSDSTKLNGEDFKDLQIPKSSLASLSKPQDIISPRPVRELDAAATKVQNSTEAIGQGETWQIARL